MKKLKIGIVGARRGADLAEHFKSADNAALAALFFSSSAAGIGSCIGNGILSYLCTKINGGILYPFINGGLCVTVAIFSFAIFREKADKLKILSLITGIAAIILLNI